MDDKLLLKFLDLITPEQLFNSNFTTEEINSLTEFEVNKRGADKTRYFVFFFEGQKENGTISRIRVNEVAYDGKMPSFDSFKKTIEEHCGTKFEWITLTGFQEMNEEDYNNMWGDDE